MGNEAIEIVREFDDALVEFVKVSDLSGEALDEYTQKLGELGEATMKSRTQMLESATEFRKSGFTDEQSAQLAQVATMFQNVADSELSAGDSASFVISQMKAFGMTTTEEAQSIIDKTNAVSNAYAVSSTDISSALTKTSSAMATYGNSIDESIALTCN
jgi:TP901 family phage tail tape measure protein